MLGSYAVIVLFRVVVVRVVFQVEIIKSLVYLVQRFVSLKPRPKIKSYICKSNFWIRSIKREREKTSHLNS